MLLKLKPYQLKTVEYGLKNPYCILGLQMGLGKSPVALAIFEACRAGDLVIVCPAYLVLNWKAEIEKCFGKEYDVWAIQKSSDISEDAHSMAQITIVSFNMAQKAEFIFESVDMLIIDEAHSLSSMDAKRTQFMHRVIYENSIPRVYLLTGTPIKNRVHEFYSLISICNYNPTLERSGFLNKFEDSITFADYFSYREEYTVLIGNRYIPVIKWKGVRKKEELKEYLSGIYIRFSSKDVLDLPPIVYKGIVISTKTDKKLWEEFQNWSNEGGDSVNPTYKALAALKKVPFTVQYVNNILEEVGSVAIYTDHTESCKAIAQAFGVPAITGAMPPKKRLELAQAFQKGESKVIAATIKSFSTGVNLTRCSNMVLNDFPWVPGEVSQTVYRIQRIGQKNQCVIHQIFGSPQDAQIMRALEEKAATIAEVT